MIFGGNKLSKRQAFALIMMGIGVTFIASLNPGAGAGILGFGFLLFISG
ncbi:MAG: hypothetical protein HOK84_07985 [Bacteroidetes bacterium]|jgi:hypothetical protein|nr:hypothetical protein [Bacteroidota bacterium]